MNGSMLELVDLPNEKVLRELALRYPEIDVDPAAIALGLIYIKIGSEILRYAETYFQQHDVSDGRFSVLMLLMRSRATGGLTPSNLAERAGVTRATITGLIDGLEKMGHVRRSVDETDKRKQTIDLTAKGIKFIDKVYPTHLERMSHLMDALTADDKKDLARISGRMRDRLCEVFTKAKLNCRPKD
jgi:DNA-binding MarR family transcriptional regulator